MAVFEKKYSPFPYFILYSFPVPTISISLRTEFFETFSNAIKYVSITGVAAEQIVYTISKLNDFNQRLILNSGEIQIQGSPNQNLTILFQGKNLGEVTDILDKKLNTMGSAAFATTANGSVVITGTLANSLEGARLATDHVLCKKVTTPNFPGFDPISHNRCEIK